MKTVTGRSPHRRPVPRQVYPKTIEGSYLVAIRALLRQVYDQVKAHVIPLLPAAAAQAKELRGDAAPEDVRKEIAAVRITARGVFSDQRVGDIARQIADRTKDYQHGQLSRQLKTAVGVEIPITDPKYQERLEAFTAENVALITSIPGQFLDQVQSAVMAGINNGERAEELASDIEERYGVSESRAALIARDQIGKFYGALTRATQSELGIEKFVWRTMEDERVRPEHEDLDGETFDWEKGAPVEGFPGEPISCRCTADPDVSGLLESLEEE